MIPAGDPLRARWRWAEPEARETPEPADAGDGSPFVRGWPERAEIRWGHAKTPWGLVRVVWSRGTLLRCGFEDAASAIEAGSPRARSSPCGLIDTGTPVDNPGAQAWVDLWIAHGPDLPDGVRFAIDGTPFQIRVWRALMRIPRGSVTSYGRLAAALGMPRAARAVGAACGANRLALWVPCHRVVRDSGVIHGYRWGVSRKESLLAWEAGLRPGPGPFSVPIGPAQTV